MQKVGIEYDTMYAIVRNNGNNTILNTYIGA